MAHWSWRTNGAHRCGSPPQCLTNASLMPQCLCMARCVRTAGCPKRRCQPKARSFSLFGSASTSFSSACQMVAHTGTGMVGRARGCKAATCPQPPGGCSSAHAGGRVHGGVHVRTFQVEMCTLRMRRLLTIVTASAIVTTRSGQPRLCALAAKGHSFAQNSVCRAAGISTT